MNYLLELDIYFLTFICFNERWIEVEANINL